MEVSVTGISGAAHLLLPGSTAFSRKLNGNYRLLLAVCTAVHLQFPVWPRFKTYAVSCTVQFSDFGSIPQFQMLSFLVKQPGTTVCFELLVLYK